MTPTDYTPLDLKAFEGHTKGPWSVMEDRPWVVIMPEMALCGEGHKYAAFGGGDNEVNARLGAAAPQLLRERCELLAALKSLIGHIGCGTALACEHCTPVHSLITRIEGTR